jgi:hypothetical protein
MEVTSYAGFRFVRGNEEPYKRKDGTWTVLAVWHANCRKCGEAFTVKTPASAKQYTDSKSFGSRHCDKHKLQRQDMSAFKTALAAFKPDAAQA